MRMRQRIGGVLVIVAVAMGGALVPASTAFAAEPTPVVVEENDGAEVEEAAEAASDEKPVVGKEFCDAGQYTKNRVATAIRTPLKSWLVDSRGSSHATTLKRKSEVTRSKAATWTVSTGVSTSVKAGLKLLAEAKIDVSFGAEYSTTSSVTISASEEWTMVFPANRYSRWTLGFIGAKVTADVYSISRDCRTRYVGKATAYWPADEALWYTRLA